MHVVHAAPRAGTGTFNTKVMIKVTCACAMRWYSDPRGLFSHHIPAVIIFKIQLFLQLHVGSCWRGAIRTCRGTANNMPHYAYIHHSGVWSLVGERINRMLYHKMVSLPKGATFSSAILWYTYSHDYVFLSTLLVSVRLL
jgi:hypothetical protein